MKNTGPNERYIKFGGKFIVKIIVNKVKTNLNVANYRWHHYLQILHLINVYTRNMLFFIVKQSHLRHFTSVREEDYWIENRFSKQRNEGREKLKAQRKLEESIYWK